MTLKKNWRLEGIKKLFEILNRRAKDFKPPTARETSPIFKDHTKQGVSRKRIIEDQTLILNRSKGRRVGEEDRRESINPARKQTKFGDLTVPYQRRGQKNVTAVEMEEAKRLFKIRDSQRIANEEGRAYNPGTGIDVQSASGKKLGRFKKAPKTPLGEAANRALEKLFEHFKSMNRP
jgi:hypothetical protein